MWLFCPGRAGTAAEDPAKEEELLRPRFCRRCPAAEAPAPSSSPSSPLTLALPRPTWAELLGAILHVLRPRTAASGPAAAPDKGCDMPERVSVTVRVAVRFAPANGKRAALDAPPAAEDVPPAGLDGPQAVVPPPSQSAHPLAHPAEAPDADMTEVAPEDAPAKAGPPPLPPLEAGSAAVEEHMAAAQAGAAPELAGDRDREGAAPMTSAQPSDAGRGGGAESSPAAPEAGAAEAGKAAEAAKAAGAAGAAGAPAADGADDAAAPTRASKRLVLRRCCSDQIHDFLLTGTSR